MKFFCDCGNQFEDKIMKGNRDPNPKCPICGRHAKKRPTEASRRLLNWRLKAASSAVSLGLKRGYQSSKRRPMVGLI